jgi:DHA3 family tetracycline resistance protein-like MFS transporter
MLGRVSSLDWLISIGLLPLSFALTAPIAGAIGARATLLSAAVIGGVATLGALFLPGMRDIEGRANSEPEASTMCGNGPDLRKSTTFLGPLAGDEAVPQAVSP